MKRESERYGESFYRSPLGPLPALRNSRPLQTCNTTSGCCALTANWHSILVIGLPKEFSTLGPGRAYGPSTMVDKSTHVRLSALTSARSSPNGHLQIASSRLMILRRNGYGKPPSTSSCAAAWLVPSLTYLPSFKKSMIISLLVAGTRSVISSSPLVATTEPCPRIQPFGSGMMLFIRHRSKWVDRSTVRRFT
ncbi:hypothetical protein CCHR01_19243 [Colletotrichum chrysophilum]|uniref:Uncharacterized protein n=1 Tax=Colletotrichum chrysophilum TaxID=1836956 RepID=A0AAD8ZYL4_9PEZI|nr:hypothetical protein CCHR01_19243 [Colletotrichum chrysophilum]